MAISPLNLISAQVRTYYSLAIQRPQDEAEYLTKVVQLVQEFFSTEVFNPANNDHKYLRNAYKSALESRGGSTIEREVLLLRCKGPDEDADITLGLVSRIVDKYLCNIRAAHDDKKEVVRLVDGLRDHVESASFKGSFALLPCHTFREFKRIAPLEDEVPLVRFSPSFSAILEIAACHLLPQKKLRHGSVEEQQLAEIWQKRFCTVSLLRNSRISIPALPINHPELHFRHFQEEIVALHNLIKELPSDMTEEIWDKIIKSLLSYDPGIKFSDNISLKIFGGDNCADHSPRKTLSILFRIGYIALSGIDRVLERKALHSGLIEPADIEAMCDDCMQAMQDKIMALVSHIATLSSCYCTLKSPEYLPRVLEQLYAMENLLKASRSKAVFALGQKRIAAFLKKILTAMREASYEEVFDAIPESRVLFENIEHLAASPVILPHYHESDSSGEEASSCPPQCVAPYDSLSPPVFPSPLLNFSLDLEGENMFS